MRKLARFILPIVFVFGCAVSGFAQNTNQPSMPTPTPAAKRQFKHNGRFITRYDKFKDQTSIILAPFPVTGTIRYVMSSEMLGMGAMFIHPGQKLSRTVDKIALYFQSSSKDWKYLRDRQLIALIDGERVPLGEGERNSDIKLGGVEETLFFPISRETLARITNGKMVEIQLGGVREFVLKDKLLEALRDFESRMTP